MKKKAKLPAPTTNPLDENPLLSLMREYNAPMTREEFLDLNYCGSVPNEISPEEEADFPSQFQLNPEPDEDSED